MDIPKRKQNEKDNIKYGLENNNEQGGYETDTYT